jgi:hypothetical protein
MAIGAGWGVRLEPPSSGCTVAVPESTRGEAQGTGLAAGIDAALSVKVNLQRGQV